MNSLTDHSVIPVKLAPKFYAFIIFIVGILIAHLLILTVYVNHYLLASKNSMTINSADYTLIRLIQNAHMSLSNAEFSTYIHNLSHAGIKLNDYNVNIQLTKQPLWSPDYSGNSQFSMLENDLLANKINDAFSLQLAKDSWLNYKTSFSYNFYIISLLMILLELILVGFVLLYVWSIWRFVSPLKHFKQSAEQLGIDVNASPIIATGPNIVRETATALNQMQQRIQNLINSRTKMLAAISHDLRTPITRLKLRCQLLNDETEIEKFTADLDEMEAMIASVLNFAKTDAPQEKKSKFDINSLIVSLCHDFMDRGCAVSIHSDEQQCIPITARSLSLKRAFTNLIENGIKYGNAVEINVTCDFSQERVHITIDDHGPGIDESELEKVFEPYYRAARHQQSQHIAGTGLGLSIAHEVFRAHNGSIDLSNRPSGGLRVCITLPCEPITLSSTHMAPTLNS